MLCKAPYFVEAHKILVPCNQCLPCRISRRRHWTSRLILEMFSHSEAVFLTLTYNDDNLPADRCISKREVQLFLKRLRKFIYPRKIRYFFCGEYGSKSFRPHYHAIIFGMNMLETEAFNLCWNKGFVYTGDVNPNSIQYVAGYCAKSVSAELKSYFDTGALTKEFILTSRRPGLGALAVEKLVDLNFKHNKGLECFSEFRYDGKKWPIPRFLRDKVEKLLFDSDYLELKKKAKILNMQDDVKQLITKNLTFFEEFLWKDDMVHLSTLSYYRENYSKAENVEKKFNFFNKRCKI